MNDPHQTPKERAAKFVGALRHTRHDRGKLAALRRGLSPSTVMEAWPVVAALGGDIGQPVFVTTAALFATHPEDSNARNFGETCRRIALDGGKEIPDSFERRFRRLLACGEVEEVLGQLRSWIRLAANKSVGVNYDSLMFDLIIWNKYSDDIRVKWARSFWQGADTPTNNTATA